MYVRNISPHCLSLRYNDFYLTIPNDGIYHIVPHDFERAILLQSYIPKHQQIISFVMPLKARSELALEAIKNIVSEFNTKYFDFIIVEAKSKDPLIIPDKYKPFIKHYYVDMRNKWNRSKLLNYGFKRSETPLVAGWDVDFRFSNKFFARFLQVIAPMNFTKKYLSVVTTEAFDSIRQGIYYPKGSYYGGFHVHFRKHIDDLNGYDESFNGFGWEEVDMMTRTDRYVDPQNWRNYKIASSNEYKEPDLIWHKSHGDDLRSSNFKYLESNKQKLLEHYENNVTVLEQPNWGESCKLLRFNNIIQ